jgi:DNA replication licensing factor MCM5
MAVHMNAGQVGASEPKEGELPLPVLKRFINFCRTRCGPRLSASAGEKLRSRYVLMRSGTVEQEKAMEKRLSIPITVR